VEVDDERLRTQEGKRREERMCEWKRVVKV